MPRISLNILRVVAEQYATVGVRLRRVDANSRDVIDGNGEAER